MPVADVDVMRERRVLVRAPAFFARQSGHYARGIGAPKEMTADDADRVKKAGGMGANVRTNADAVVNVNRFHGAW